MKTNCSDCVHNNVCRFKDQYKSYVESLMRVQSPVGLKVTVEHRCEHYKSEDINTILIRKDG